MRYQSLSFLRERNTLFLRSFVILFINCLIINFSLCFSGIPSSLKTLPLNGHFSFDEINHAARDFGNRYQFFPLAVLHPKSVSDIATTIRHIWQLGPGSELTLAARGHGHSLQGQSQAHQGVVINMESLGGQEMHIHTGKQPYVDVSGGELWINILHESLFHGVLGGLGQFGIITRARISLFHNTKLSEQVKWIRVLYSDFSTFARDQEHLISSSERCAATEEQDKIMP